MRTKRGSLVRICYNGKRQERGENRASAGTAKLEEWWKSLTNGERVAMKNNLPAWKATAATV